VERGRGEGRCERLCLYVQVFVYVFVYVCYRFKVAEAGFDWCVSTMREKCAEEKTDER